MNADKQAQGGGELDYTDIANRAQEITGRSIWPSTVKAVLEAAGRLTPPSAPVGVEDRAREAVALSLDEDGLHAEANNVRKGIDLDEYRAELLAARIAASLAQQPAAVDGAMDRLVKAAKYVSRTCNDCQWREFHEALADVLAAQNGGVRHG